MVCLPWLASDRAWQPLQKAAVGCALARLHKLIKDGFFLIEVLPSFEEFCATVSALVEVVLASGDRDAGTMRCWRGTT